MISGQELTQNDPSIKKRKPKGGKLRPACWRERKKEVYKFFFEIF